ncbi:MAG: ABC transporter ATP-binding protein/permease [Phyllobacterium sp.]
MTGRVSKTAKVSETGLGEFEIGFFAQVRMMIDAFRRSTVRNQLFLLAGALLIIIIVTAYGQVQLNRWNVPFYDALSRRNLPEFFHQLGVFAVIASILLLLNVSQTWFNQMTALKMREGLARDLVDQWMVARRALRLTEAGEIGINPDQRMHEDARHLAEITTSLGIGLVQATIMLFSFLGVLWALSSGFIFHVGGRSFSIPGYMVWAAILYAGSASLLSYFVGRRLVRLNANRYSKEAELRFSLMRANEHLALITLAKGEENERNRLHGDINGVLAVIRQLALALTNLTWVTAGYGWLTIVAPILIAAPVYFAGELSFGGLMMAVGAFNQVHSSLRWYVDNFGAIADWKATLFRVATFRAAVIAMDRQLPEEGSISYGPSLTGDMSFRGLEIATSRDANEAEEIYRLREGDVTIKAGERVMLNGEAGLNRKLVFGAIAGLWRWGSGQIRVPATDTVQFMPQVPYLPRGTLRDALAYPREAGAFSSIELTNILDKVGLGRMLTMLDNEARWDRMISDDEQVAISFARLLLHKPRWIVFDEVLEGLEPDMQKRLAKVIAEVPDVTLIYIGRSETFAKMISPRILHLERKPFAA